MSHRLHVLVPAELDSQLQKAAQRSQLSKGEWVRRALREALSRSAKPASISDRLARLAGLQGPRADIDQMLEEIEAGRN